MYKFTFTSYFLSSYVGSGLQSVTNLKTKYSDYHRPWTAYHLQLEQQHSHIKTEILLLEKYLKLKQRSAAIIRRENQIITRPKVYRIAPHPLEDSQQLLEIFYHTERLRFQCGLCSISLNVPTPTTILYKEQYKHIINELSFHQDHYHCILNN